jgi:chromate reductase, NAD(P)H dehydrogenase (quinone)
VKRCKFKVRSSLRALCFGIAMKESLMATSRDIAVLVGSLRTESLNRKTAKAFIELAPAPLELEIVEIGQLPLFNEDLEKDPPREWTEFRERIGRADGVLFVTPEYNRSIPAVIKNAIDWGSRPRGQSSWTRKPVAIAGSSPGTVGSAVAQSHLRSIIVTQDVILMGHPEVYFVFSSDAIRDDGTVADASSAAFLKGFLDRFSSWIAMTSP